MNETELENLVVRLTGDASQLVGTFKEGAAAATSAAQQIEQATGKVKGLIATATQSLAGLGVVAWLGAAQRKFEDAQMNVMRLRAAIEANGNEVASVEAKYMKFAGTVASTTTTSKGAALGMLQQAEALNLTGDAAQQAVRDAIALAAVNKGQPEEYLRMAAGLQQGNTFLLRRIPQLRGVRDETELLARANKLMSQGYKIAAEEGQTIGAQTERLWRTFGGLQREIGGVVVEGLKPLIPQLQRATTWLANMSPEVKRNVVAIGGLVAGYLVLRPALAMTQIAMAPVLALVKFLVVDFLLLGTKLVVTSALWLVWKAATLLAAGVVGLFNAQLAVYNFLLSASAVGAAAWSAGSTIAAAATWVWNTALAVTNALLAAPVLLAAAGTIGAIAAALLLVTAAGMAAWNTATGLYDVLASMPSNNAALSQIGTLFKQWYAALKDVIQVAKTDLPAAWVLFQAYLSIGVHQVQDLFPPLWKFIRTGFDEVWFYVSNRFVTEFTHALERITNDIAMQFPNIFANGEKGLQELWQKQQKAHAEAVAELDRTLRMGLGRAAKGIDIQESLETKQAISQLAVVRVEAAANILGKSKAEAEKLGDQLGTYFAKGAGKEAKDLQASLSKGTDSLSRIAEYRDKLTGGKGGMTVGGTDARGAGALQLQRQQVDLTKRIVEELQKGNNKPGGPVIEDANVGGG